jgi:hypothetical protein
MGNASENSGQFARRMPTPIERFDVNRLYRPSIIPKEDPWDGLPCPQLG